MRFPEANPWIAYGLSTLIVVAAGESGRALGLYWWRRRPDAVSPELTTLEAAALGLLALMIGFTFSMALTRFDTRLRGVLDEANSIGTTALRAQLLPAPDAAAVKQLLRDYAGVRIDLIRGTISQETATRRSNRLQTALWRHAVAAAAADPRSVPAGLFASSLNRMIDLQEIRLAAARNRVPPAVLLLLYGIAVVAIGLSGYVAGITGRAGRIPHAIMAVMIAGVIAMVADIDRSQSGLVTVSQQSMLNLEMNLR